MFQWDLAQIRRIKGKIIPAFLPDDSNGYASSVIELVSSSVNKTRREVDKSSRELELKVQYHKTLRAIYTVFMRECDFVAPSVLNSQEVREEVFIKAAGAVIDTEARNLLLREVAGKFGSDPGEVEAALLGDLESEQILEKVPEISPNALIKRYNFELFETILLRCKSLKFFADKGLRSLITSVKVLGLIYKPIAEGSSLKGIEISGPVSILEGTRRYGSRFAKLVKIMISLPDWSVEAQIADEERRGGNTYSLTVESSVAGYFPEFTLDFQVSGFIPGWASDREPKPVVIGSKVYFPDFAFRAGDQEVLVDVSSPIYEKFNRERDQLIRSAGIRWQTIYLLFEDSKMVKGELCFYDPINWDNIRKVLTERNAGMKKVEISPSVDLSPEEAERLRAFVEKEISNPEMIVEYIQGEGYNPSRVLPALGYRIKWKGLNLEISPR